MELIFVYNADSGLFHALKDAFHKTFFPKTYPCSLCALTYGSTSEKKDWKQFRQQQTIPMRFLHKDEYEAQFDFACEYPAVLLKNDDLQTVIQARELNAITSLNDLIAQVESIITLQTTQCSMAESLM